MNKLIGRLFAVAVAITTFLFMALMVVYSMSYLIEAMKAADLFSALLMVVLTILIDVFGVLVMFRVPMSYLREAMKAADLFSALLMVVLTILVGVFGPLLVMFAVPYFAGKRVYYFAIGEPYPKPQYTDGGYPRLFGP